MKKTARRYDIVKYCDETQATEAEEEDEHENPNYHLRCMFLVFRIAHESFGDAGHRDFALVRRLKPTPRHDGGQFPRMPCEKRMEDFDIEETNNKLGVLWTWDFDPSSRQPIYTILRAEELQETVPMMPHWEPNSANWSIRRGVFKNKFLMDPRRRPPWPKRCQCLD